MVRAGVGILIVVGAAGAASAGNPALDKPAFTATPAELLAAARSAPAGDWPVVVLREDHAVTVDDRGRVTERERTVFVVRASSAIKNWGRRSIGWWPHTERPTLRARVIQPDGTSADADPKLAVESAAQTSGGVASEARTLEMPLPPLQVGSVVEVETVVIDREPPIGGDSIMIRLGHSVPTMTGHITVSAPVARRVHHVTANLPRGTTAAHSKSGATETWTYDAADVPPFPDGEPYEPGDAHDPHFFAWSTAASWKAIAEAYRATVDRPIAAGPFALPADLPRAPTLATVRAISAWLRRHVRYTGIDFGGDGVVPSPPADTVKRRTADCRDLATLLVALLRQTGIRADLALLHEGPGVDTMRELPGLGYFTHAVVRARVGATDVWIDPTEDLAAPGQLPARAQGRLALIVASDTADLVMTASARSADNHLHEVRTYELAEAGAARLTEVARDSGTFEEYQRSWVRDTPLAERRESLAKYVAEEYQAKLDTLTATDPEDLDRPFEMTMTALAVRRAWTERDRISVTLFPGDTLSRLPKVLKADRTEARHADFVWYDPYTYEIENRLVFPPGYAPPAATPDRVRTLGTATFSEKRRVEGHTLIVTFKFDTGKLRLTPAEFTKLREELGKIRDEEVDIEVERTASALASAGKFREAIAECQRLIALHPKEGLHHAELAMVLTQAGLGEAGRREARKAVELAPKDADAYVVLGWVLRQDSLGREDGWDADRAGALAAFRKARQLDPDHLGNLTELASLLELGTSGERYDKGSDLRAALEVRRAAFAADASNSRGEALVRLLLRMGDVAEAERIARGLSSSSLRDSLLVTAVAATKGAAAAAAEATASKSKLAGKDAVFELLAMRSYPLARELAAAINVPANAAFAKLDKVVRVDRTGPFGLDARAAVIDMIHLAFDPRYATPVFWDAATEAEHREELYVRGARQHVRATNIAFVYDLTAGVPDLLTVEQVDGLWRVSGDVVQGGRRFHAYLARDGKNAKVVATSERFEGAGRHVLRMLANRDDAGAARLLDWMRTDLDAHPSPTIADFKAVWGTGLGRDRPAMTLAAAVLAGSTDAPRTIPILAKCASPIGGARAACDEMLAFVHSKTGSWRELEAHSSEWSARDPDGAARVRVIVLVHARNFDAADALADDLIKRGKSVERIARLRVLIAAARGDTAEAMRRGDALIHGPSPSAIDYNAVAWLHYILGSDVRGALDLAHKAVGSDKSRADSHVLNTLGSIEAELGDFGAAKDDLWRAMEQRHGVVPDDGDWYSIARYAERLGLASDAIAIYRRIRPTPGADGIDQSPFELAAVRLRALGVKP